MPLRLALEAVAVVVSVAGPKSISANQASEINVTGDLTIHGVTKPVTFDVQPLSKEMKNPMGATIVGTSATAKINRKEFGLNWNQLLETGGVLVGEKIEITLDVQAVKAQASEKAA